MAKCKADFVQSCAAKTRRPRCEPSIKPRLQESPEATFTVGTLFEENWCWPIQTFWVQWSGRPSGHGVFRWGTCCSTNFQNANWFVDSAFSCQAGTSIGIENLGGWVVHIVGAAAVWMLKSWEMTHAWRALSWRQPQCDLQTIHSKLAGKVQAQFIFHTKTRCSIFSWFDWTLVSFSSLKTVTSEVVHHPLNICQFERLSRMTLWKRRGMVEWWMASSADTSEWQASWATILFRSFPLIARWFGC